MKFFITGLLASLITLSANATDFSAFMSATKSMALELTALEGTVAVSTGGLMKKLGVINGEFTGDITQIVEKYKNVERKNLHEQNIDMRNCRREIFSKAVDKLYQPASS